MKFSLFNKHKIAVKLTMYQNQLSQKSYFENFKITYEF